MLGPIIAGDRITLAPTAPEYLPEFIRWFADTEVTRYLLSPFPMSLRQEEEWFENVCKDRNAVHWTIIADKKPVGVAGLHIDWPNQGATTGTIIGVRDQWGKGIATEVVKLRTAFAFKELNLHRLETNSFRPNAGMHKALERSGYQRIGVRTKAMFRYGDWFDTVLFELLRDDWLRLQADTAAK